MSSGSSRMFSFSNGKTLIKRCSNKLLSTSSFGGGNPTLAAPNIQNINDDQHTQRYTFKKKIQIMDRIQTKC